jgi:hypothetical protein
MAKTQSPESVRMSLRGDRCHKRKARLRLCKGNIPLWWWVRIASSVLEREVLVNAQSAN